MATIVSGKRILLASLGSGKEAPGSQATVATRRQGDRVDALKVWHSGITIMGGCWCDQRETRKVETIRQH